MMRAGRDYRVGIVTYVRKTAAELQALAAKLRGYGQPVHHIPPSAVDRFTKRQVPHIVVWPLPKTGGEKP